MPKLKAPEHHYNISFDGKEYEVDSEGYVNVPDEAVNELVSHGYRQVDESEQSSKSAERSKKHKPND